MRTQRGSVNFYDNGRCVGTAIEKTWAARSGGHAFNIISHERTKILRHLRNNGNCDGKFLDYLLYMLSKQVNGNNSWHKEIRIEARVLTLKCV